MRTILKDGWYFPVPFILLVMLIASVMICIILGMGMPATGIYVLLATLAAPPLIKLGVDPLAAHIFFYIFD